MSGGRRSACRILGAVAVVIGVWGSIAALDAPFTAERGTPLARLMNLNLLGALVTLAGGVLAVGAGAVGRRAAAALPGLLFGAATLITLVGLGRSFNPLGGRGNTLSFFLMETVGLLALALMPELPSGEAASVVADTAASGGDAG